MYHNLSLDQLISVCGRALKVQLFFGKILYFKLLFYCFSWSQCSLDYEFSLLWSWTPGQHEFPPILNSHQNFFLHFKIKNVVFVSVICWSWIEIYEKLLHADSYRTFCLFFCAPMEKTICLQLKDLETFLFKKGNFLWELSAECQHLSPCWSY